MNSGLGYSLYLRFRFNIQGIVSVLYYLTYNPLNHD